eukprot:scaffold103827_cov29-Tisochrysis_lutea.AAC.1
MRRDIDAAASAWALESGLSLAMGTSGASGRSALRSASEQPASRGIFGSSLTRGPRASSTDVRGPFEPMDCMLDCESSTPRIRPTEEGVLGTGGGSICFGAGGSSRCLGGGGSSMVGAEPDESNHQGVSAAALEVRGGTWGGRTSPSRAVCASDKCERSVRSVCVPSATGLAIESAPFATERPPPEPLVEAVPVATAAPKRPEKEPLRRP